MGTRRILGPAQPRPTQHRYPKKQKDHVHGPGMHSKAGGGTAGKCSPATERPRQEPEAGTGLARHPGTRHRGGEAVANARAPTQSPPNPRSDPAGWLQAAAKGHTLPRDDDRARRRKLADQVKAGRRGQLVRRSDGTKGRSKKDPHFVCGWCSNSGRADKVGGGSQSCPDGCTPVEPEELSFARRKGFRG